MGQPDLDPRTIHLNFYCNLPVEILFPYAYAVQRDSIMGQLQHVLERVLHIDVRLRRNKSKVLTEMMSREHQYIGKMNVLYLYNMKITQFMEILLPQVIKMKIFTLCYFVNCPPTDWCRVHMSLSFAGNPNFVNKLRFYTFKIEFMYGNLIFSFLLWKNHIYIL